MTPIDYVNEFVIPTIVEYLHNGLDRRRAYLSCIVTFHICDHLKRSAGKVDVEETVKKNMPIGGEVFDIVHGICNATKHAGPVEKTILNLRLAKNITGSRFHGVTERLDGEILSWK